MLSAEVNVYGYCKNIALIFDLSLVTLSYDKCHFFCCAS